MYVLGAEAFGFGLIGTVGNAATIPTTAMLGSLLFAACLATPDTADPADPQGTPDPPATDEAVGESQSALVKKWDHLTSLRMGGADADAAARVATDSSGNMIVAGTFSGSMTVGGGATALTSAGASDAFVVKLSPGGAVQWSLRLGGAGADSATSVAVDGAGNVLVTGTMTGPVDLGGGPVEGHAYLLKLNACGTHVWSKGFTPLYPSAWSEPRDVAANAAGTIALAGHQVGAVDFGGGNILSPGGSDTLGPFVQSIAADGTFLWGHAGNPGPNIGAPAAAVAIDATGNVALVGENRFTMDLGGCQTSATMPYSDIFVRKFTATGACVFATMFGGADGQSFDHGTDVAFGAGGAVVAAGDMGAGTVGGVAVPGGSVLVSLTSTGAVAWVRPFGQANVRALATDSAGTVNIGGHFSGTVNVGGADLTSAGGHDIFFARYSSASTHLWSVRHGNTLDQATSSAAAAPNGNALFVGSFHGALSFGGGSLTSAGSTDVFLARYGLTYVQELDPVDP